MTGFYVIMMIINVPFMFDSCVVHDYVYCILLNMIDFLVIICTVFCISAGLLSAAAAAEVDIE